MSHTTMNLPPKSDLVALVKELTPSEGYWLTRHDEPLSDEVFPTAEAAEAAMEENEDATDFAPVFEILTVGWTPETGGWSYQTGDNSFTGGAYRHPVWAVIYLTFQTDVEGMADEILDQLAEQASF